MGMWITFIRKFVARTYTQISQKAIDYFSLIHILFGLISYYLLYFIMMLIGLPIDFISGMGLAYVMNISLVWEFFENFILSKTKLKKNSRKDSLQNSLMDLVFTEIGGIIGFLRLNIFLNIIIIQNIITLGLLWRYVTKKR